MSSPHQSPERIERSIIRMIGRVRFEQLKECVTEGVSIAFLVEEFGLNQTQIQYITREAVNTVDSMPIRTIRTR